MVNGCVIQDNESRGSAGGGTSWYGTTTVTDTVFRSNRAGGSGGGLFVYLGSLEARDVAFIDNVADHDGEAWGGGLYWLGTGPDYATLDGVTATGNRLTTDRGTAFGGGLAFHGDGTGVVTLTRATLTDNRASSETEDAFGGGLAVSANAPPMTLAEVVAEGNAAEGPAGAAGGAAWVSVGGRGEVLVIDTLAATGNRVAGDDTSVGGALALEVLASSGTVRLDGLELSDNAVTDIDGGGPTGTGGGLYLDLDRASLAVSVDNSTLSGGAASRAGGAEVRLGGGSTLAVNAMRAQGNEGDGLGLVAVGSAVVVEVARSAFLDNVGAGVSVLAEAGDDVVVSLPGDAHAHSAVAGNTTGLALSCGPNGGSCSVASPAVDFVSESVPNLDCDVDVDGTCFPDLGDAAAIGCWSDASGSGCE